MEELTLMQADRIASSIIACIKRNNFKPVSVSITDQKGHILV